GTWRSGGGAGGRATTEPRPSAGGEQVKVGGCMGKPPSERPPSQPYGENPAVRNDRGGSRRRRHHSKPGPRLGPTRPIHIGPEPCVGVRKDADEASVGEGIGQPLSRESQSPGADAVSSAEGNTFRTHQRKVRTARRGRRTWHVQKLLGREPGDPTSGQLRCAALARIGKARSRSR